MNEQIDERTNERDKIARKTNINYYKPEKHYRGVKKSNFKPTNY